jgi:hypothetical protein
VKCVSAQGSRTVTFYGRKYSARRVLRECADGTRRKELIEFYHMHEGPLRELLLGY